jgi:hypothetical protein
LCRENYDPTQLPSHPWLKTVANCEQVFSSHTSRRLIVMEKVGKCFTENIDLLAKLVLALVAAFPKFMLGNLGSPFSVHLH